MRWLVASALALAIALGVWMITRSPGDSEAPSPNQVAVSFIEKYVNAEGRIADTGNGGITHSEGQGYGLLMAEAANEREVFDRILLWTDQNLAVREDALFAWRWDPAHDAVTDLNNASDGEILIAWALLRAYDRWHAPFYRDRALEILQASESSLLRDSAFGTIILPGAAGFEKSGGAIVNLSYWVFPAFERFAQEGRPVWNEVARSGYRLTDEAAFGGYRLNADWTWIAADGAVAPADDWLAEFGYNAVRVPLHACWAQDAASAPARKEILNRYATFWRSNEPGLSDRWSLETDAPVGWPAPMAFGSIAKLTAACAGDSDSLPTPSLEAEEPYYSAALKGLVSLAAQDLTNQSR